MFELILQLFVPLFVLLTLFGESLHLCLSLDILGFGLFLYSQQLSLEELDLFPLLLVASLHQLHVLLSLLECLLFLPQLLQLLIPESLQIVHLLLLLPLEVAEVHSLLRHQRLILTLHFLCGLGLLVVGLYRTVQLLHFLLHSSF